MQSEEAPQSPVIPAVPASFSPRRNRKPLLITTGIVLFLLLALLLLIFLKPEAKKTAPTKQQAAQATLTISQQPYVHPCSVVSRTDFAAAFGLDIDNQVGSVYEKTAILPPGSKETDLMKLAPDHINLSPVYSSNCDITLAKKNAATVNDITVQISQYPTAEKAKSHFDSGKMLDAQTSDGQKLSVPPLASFPDNSYTKLPRAEIHTIDARVLHNNLLLNLQYSLDATQGETVDNVFPKIDALAQKIITKLNDKTLASQQLDMTGVPSFVGLKLVDICQQADRAVLAKSLGNFQYRADGVIFLNAYGALEGSLAARDGIESYCQYHFRTPTDAKNQAALKSSTLSRLSLANTYPHSISLSVHSFRSAADAKSWLASKQAKTQGAQAVSGLGDAAFKSHLEQAIPGTVQSNVQTSQRMSVSDRYGINKGVDVIIIDIVQKKEIGGTYDTVPFTLTDTPIQKVYNLIQTALKKRT